VELGEWNASREDLKSLTRLTGRALRRGGGARQESTGWGSACELKPSSTQEKDLGSGGKSAKFRPRRSQEKGQGGHIKGRDEGVLDIMGLSDIGPAAERDE